MPTPAPASAAELAKLLAGWKPAPTKASKPKPETPPKPKPETKPAPPPADLFTVPGEELKIGELIPPRPQATPPAEPAREGEVPAEPRATTIPRPAKKAKPAPAPETTHAPATPAFETHDDIHAWAKSRLPNAKINLEGIPVKSWQVIAAEMDHLLERFPDIAKRLREFGSMPADVPADMVASAIIAGSKSIQFNPACWKDLAKLAKNFEADCKSGWNPKGVSHAGPSYYVTHEFGHLVHGYLGDTDPAKREKLDLLVGHKVIPSHPYIKFEPETAKAISKYAATSYAESFAESFAAARWNKNPRNAIVQSFQRNFRELRP